jgi:type III pantothenate kinase
MIGSSTKDAIVTGVQAGLIHEITGFVKLYSERFKSLRVLMTGGNAKFFAGELNFPIFAAPNLTAIGLHEILVCNLKKK